MPLTCGIGMIHQHFKLVDVFTAAENIVLGLDGQQRLDLKAASAKIKEICEKYGFVIDPSKKVYNMSVSEKQTVEIVKVLYRGADILILDEPTAVLTPQETDRLFDVMRNMKADGKAMVIITHKLHEVMEVSDRVAVLRKGQYIGDVATSDTNPQKLTDMMVGHAVTLNIDRPLVENRHLRLEVKDLTVLTPDGVKALDGVSFEAFGGEILGVAGISGSGQKELLESIAGLRSAQPGSHVIYHPPSPDESIAGTHAPVDRKGEELLGKTRPPDPQHRRLHGLCAGGPSGHGPGGLHGHGGQHDAQDLPLRQGPPPQPQAPPGAGRKGEGRAGRADAQHQYAGPPALRRQCAEGAGGP